MKTFITLRFRVLALMLAGTIGVLLLCGAGIRWWGSNADAAAEVDGTIELPVVMYHHMLESSSLLGDYCIRPKDFEADLQLIRDWGYTSISVAELIAWANGEGSLPDRPILITFDDGYESTYGYAYPLLQQYGMKAVVSIIGRYTDLYSESDDHHLNYSHITWDQAREMQASGLVEIMNHSYDLHTNSYRKGCQILPGEDVEQYKMMLRQDVGALQDKILHELGTQPSCFAYPFGYRCDEAVEVLHELGFRVTLSCESGVNKLKANPDAIFRLMRNNRPYGIDSESFFAKILKRPDEVEKT